MLCKHCRQTIDVLAITCPLCGGPQSILDEPLVVKSTVDDFLNRVERSIENELAAEYRGFDGAGSPVPWVRPRESTGVGWALGRLQPQATADFLVFGENRLETAAAEIQQMAQFVFYSSHVQSNRLYRQRAARTTLHYLPEDDMVNAFATDCAIPIIDVEPPLICIQGGLTRVSRLVAAALAENAESRTTASRDHLKTVVQQLGRQVVEEDGALSLEAAEAIAEMIQGSFSDGKTRSYNAAMNMTVIAHELGHIALGHTLSESQVNPEISRNQEREADSFAASVASASPFGDYIVAGGIFFWIIMAWIDAAAGNANQPTHPHAQERLMDYIRANREQAVAIGFCADSIVDYLP